MAKAPEYEPKEITNEQFSEVHKCLANRRLLVHEYDRKLSHFTLELDEQFQPLFDAIDAEIAEILRRGTPPNERPQES